MDKIAKLRQVMLAAFANKAVPLLNGTVTAVDGESCTVLIGELELDEVRLKATINGGDNKLLLVPPVGSIVLVGSLTGDLTDLAVISCDEVEKLTYKQGQLTLEIDSTDSTVKVENATTGLKALFQQLTDLLKQFKVTTPSGPSSGLVPDTLSAIIQFESDFKTLLK